MKTQAIIVSGCMAVQARVKGNISEGELYPNVLRSLLCDQGGLEFEYQIVTVKDLSRWQENVERICDRELVSMMIVQLRTHDHLNIIRYGRTVTPKNNNSRSLSFAIRTASCTMFEY